MTNRCSRRCFLLSAATTGGGLVAAPSLVMAEVSDEDRAALRAEFALQFQTRQLESRMRLFKKLVETHGSELIGEVRQHTIDETREQFSNDHFDQRDLAGVKAYLWDSLEEGFDFECIEDTPEKLSYRVKRCFLAEAAAKHDAPEIGHAFYCAWDEGFCQGLNPKIRFTRTKTLMQGDDCCDHTYELDVSEGD